MTLHFVSRSHRAVKMAVGMAAAVASLAAHAQPMTTDSGAPVGDNQNSQTAGPNGPTLLQDAHLIQKLQRFDRERIPERVVHARGVGAHGEFVATADISALTRAAVFKPGTKTPVFVRFSTVIHGVHSPETLRDPRGFATKFYTSEGNWDLVGNNLPVFFIRDAIKFPDMVHSLKPGPDTNLQDPNRFFDFFSHLPEATHMLTRVYSDFGIPANYRQMDGSSVHAYKFVNAKGDYNYVKFAWKSRQGIKTLTTDEAREVQGKDFNNASRDLQQAIAAGQYPQWDLTIQVLKPSDLAKTDYDPLDPTKIWTNVPEQKIGTMVLNRNPANIFQETEQVAMAPSNLVPGIEPSEDRLLQGRMFSYADTQFHRLGANALQLPINRPLVAVSSNNQDGAMNSGQRTGSVNYQPSAVADRPDQATYKRSALPLSGSTQQEAISRTSNFRQAGEFFRGLDAQAQGHLIRNLSADLGQVSSQPTRTIMVSYFYKADEALGRAVAQAVKVDLAEVQRMAAKYAS